MKARIVFYISGYGFGHAIRQIEVIKALLDQAPDGIHVVVRTGAPEWLFTRAIRNSIVVLPGEVDTGVVQLDSLRLDERATIERASAFYEGLAARLEDEAVLLREHRADLVVADAPPLACAAAAAAGIASVVCGNFTWDWIYQDYLDVSADVPRLIDRIQHLYSLARSGWRLPLHGGFETFSRVEDVPLVARHASGGRTRDAVRADLNLPRDSKLALVSFGGYGVRDLPLQKVDCTGDWRIVITTRAADAPALPPGVLAVPEALIRGRGLQYQDLVHACEVIISKPGYGIISDCVANDAPLLYTSRGRFSEYDVLVREMPALLRCRYISMDDFLAGRWRESLEALRATPGPAVRPRTDGARVVASKILARLT